MNKKTAPNRHNPWTDAQLRIVLRKAPTRSNIAAMAVRFGRTENAIRHIYNVAAFRTRIKAASNAFAVQIVKVARELGWIFTRNSVAIQK